MSERIVVDPIRCTGHGLCAELFPERIELDDWGYPMVGDGAVAPELRLHARHAVNACPVVALRLVSERRA
jgi:ferredoxin